MLGCLTPGKKRARKKQANSTFLAFFSSFFFAICLPDCFFKESFETTRKQHFLCVWGSLDVEKEKLLIGRSPISFTFNSTELPAVEPNCTLIFRESGASLSPGFSKAKNLAGKKFKKAEKLLFVFPMLFLQEQHYLLLLL